MVLPTEIHQGIIDECSTNTLATFCRVSKSFNELCTKKLYESVDFKHYGRCQNTKDEDTEDEDTEDEDTEDENNTCYYRQRQFLKTLESHHEYTEYVKNIKWTLVYFEGDYYADSRLPLLPSFSDTEPQGIWKILKRLTKVTSVEIAEFDSVGQFRRNIPKNLTLFPQVTSVSLVGDFTDTFVFSVITPRKAPQLQHLHLDTVRLEALGQSDEDTTIRFLRGLLGKCTRLRSLVVIDSATNLLFPNGGPEILLPVYLDFIQSVQGTLEKLHFESKDDMPFGGISGTSPDPELLEISNKVQQVLRRGTWPCLRKATILP